MAKTLTEIAQELKNSEKKVQLVYAFNGTGKTRLSKAFQNLVTPKEDNDEVGETRKKILYYNAFTEDLFYWDNDLNRDAEPKLKIQPNAFTHWIFEEQGLEQQVISNFQHYTDEKLTPSFNKEYKTHDDYGREITIPAFSEVTFSFTRGDDTPENYIKISKGEESNFIWSVFYTLLNQVIEELQIAEPSERSTDQFNDLEYVFIDDPVSSLDENHLISLAVDLATLVRDSSSSLKFIITTHNPLFYNVIFNELKSVKSKQKSCYLLSKNEDGSFRLLEKQGDSNTSFSYHLYLRNIIEEAISQDSVQKYHFTFLRNLYEKTAAFLGYQHWSDLLPDDKQIYYARIMNFTSHSTLSNEAVAEPSLQEKQIVKFLLNHLIENHHFWKTGNAS